MSSSPQLPMMPAASGPANTASDEGARLTQRTTIDPNESTQAVHIHPVKAYLGAAGINVQNFPSISFLLEIEDRRILRPHRVFVPIHLPQSNGLIYESFFRVTRTLEFTDSHSGKKRTFLRIEWNILDQPVPARENQLLCHFLAQEFVCPNCKDGFNANIDMIGPQAIDIECPHCLHSWSLRIDRGLQQQNSQTESLFELFDLNSERLHQMVREWSETPESERSQHLMAETYFPVLWNQISLNSEYGSLKALFGDDFAHFMKVGDHSRPLRSDFGSLVKALANSTVVEYFQRRDLAEKQQRLEKEELENAALLEKTDVQRKSDILARLQDPLRTSHKRAIPQDVEVKLVLPSVTKVPTSDPFNPITAVAPSSSKLSKNAARPLRRNTFEDYDDEKTQLHDRSWFSRMKTFAYATMVFVAIFGTLAGAVSFLGYRGTKGVDPLPIQQTLNEIEIQKTTEEIKPVLETASATPSLEPKKEENLAVAAAEPAPSLPVNSTPKKKLLKIETQRREAQTQPQQQQSPRPAQEIVVLKNEAEEKVALTEKNKASQETQLQAFLRQGMLQLKVQQPIEALKSFQQALAINANHLDSLRGLGLAYVYSDRYYDAIQVLEKYLKLAPSNSMDRPAVAELLQTLKDRTRDSVAAKPTSSAR